MCPAWQSPRASYSVTVSPVGLAATGIPNNGADFGPDSLQEDGSTTVTCGIQEAIAFIVENLSQDPTRNEFPNGPSGRVNLLPGTFVVSATVNLSQNVSLVGAVENGSPRGPSTIQAGFLFSGPATPNTNTEPPTSFSGNSAIIWNDYGQFVSGPSTNGNLARGIVLRRLIVDGSPAQVKPDGIHFSNAGHYEITEVRVRGCANGIVLDASQCSPDPNVLPGQGQLESIVVEGCSGFIPSGTFTGAAAFKMYYQTQLQGQNIRILGTVGGSSGKVDALLIYASDKVQLANIWLSGTGVKSLIHVSDTSSDSTGDLLGAFTVGLAGVWCDPTSTVTTKQILVDATLTGTGAKGSGPNYIVGGRASSCSVSNNIGVSGPNVFMTVADLEGVSDAGWSIVQPGSLVVGTNTASNNNPFSVMAFLIPGGTTASVSITDAKGKPGHGGSTSVIPGTGIYYLSPGDVIVVTISGSGNPVWNWKTLE